MKILAYMIIVIATYVGGGAFLHYVVFPFEPVPLQAGDKFHSDAERISQQVDRIENGHTIMNVTVAPHAPGPPIHYHSFDEVFDVDRGTLVLTSGDDVLVLTGGQQHTVPAGAAHGFVNETNLDARGATMFPNDFAMALRDLYTYQNEHGAEGPGSLGVIAVHNADTWMPDAPHWAQQSLRFLIAPTARLLGVIKPPQPTNASSE